MLVSEFHFVHFAQDTPVIVILWYNKKQLKKGRFLLEKHPKLERRNDNHSMHQAQNHKLVLMKKAFIIMFYMLLMGNKTHWKLPLQHKKTN